MRFMSCKSLWIVCCRHGNPEGDVYGKWTVAVKEEEEEEEEVGKGRIK